MTAQPMKTRSILAVASLAAMAALQAHGAPVAPLAPLPPSPPPELLAQWMGGPMRHDTMFLAASELERERVVQNAPYCADAIHETVQTLADGNRIVQRQQTRQCRDAQGRTRQEVSNGSRKRIFLRDPVANESWVLDPDAKTATRLDAHGPDGDRQRFDWLREWGRDMREWGREMHDKLRSQLARGPQPPVPPQAPQPPQPPQSPEKTAEVTTRAVRIVMDGPDIELPPPPPLGALPPPVIALQARLYAPRGPGAVVALPAETIEGVRAEGKRTTWTLEAGKIGNEKPIVMTREVWSSPELLVTLRSRDFDPLAGEDSYRLQNVSRNDPDAALFRVPADFSRVAPGMPGQRRRG